MVFHDNKNGPCACGAWHSKKSPMPKVVMETKRPKRRRIVLQNSAYVRVSKAAIASTRELIGGKVFADFDAAGGLVGVEVL